MALSGKGHGTVVVAEDAQGECVVYIHNSSSGNYSSGNTYTINRGSFSGSLDQGEVLEVHWNEDDQQLVPTGTGSKARGTVSSDGTSFSVEDPGDTGLQDTTLISSEHGENEGFGGESDVVAGNVSGKASFLS